jgi:hypothetical protein
MTPEEWPFGILEIDELLEGVGRFIDLSLAALLSVC